MRHIILWIVFLAVVVAITYRLSHEGFHMGIGQGRRNADGRHVQRGAQGVHYGIAHAPRRHPVHSYGWNTVGGDGGSSWGWWPWWWPWCEDGTLCPLVVI